MSLDLMRKLAAQDMHCLHLGSDCCYHLYQLHNQAEQSQTSQGMTVCTADTVSCSSLCLVHRQVASLSGMLSIPVAV